MSNHNSRDKATSGVLEWRSHSASVKAPTQAEASVGQFKRAPIRQPSDHHESLLTMALQSQSEDEPSEANASRTSSRRRRSIASNVSFASTAEMTCDTGITTPARTSSPSPRRVRLGPLTQAMAKLDGSLGRSSQSKALNGAANPTTVQPFIDGPRKDTVVQALGKKRCISFACAAKPITAPVLQDVPLNKSKEASSQATVTPAPRRPCIKFACPAKALAQHTPPKEHTKQSSQATKSPVPDKEGSPATVRKYRSPSASKPRHRSSTPRRSSQSPTLLRSKKYLTANTKDLQSESSRFHEFASDTPQEDDWIRQDVPVTEAKITINDTLEKENKIRRLAKEAEEEAELEEEENDADETPNGQDAETPDANPDNDDDDDGGFPDDFSGYGSDDDVSDGYKSDNEHGFADSDGEDEHDGLGLWTLSHSVAHRLSGATPVHRQHSFGTSHSDSSGRVHNYLRAGRAKRLGIKPEAERVVPPELPDSTDFVCGTMDEDRPLEDAYVSCIEAKKREKIRTIPQDIDPSFPTSDPEDEDDGIKATGHDSDGQVWLHGEIEDLHHGQDNSERRKHNGAKTASPKRYHSPPPPKHRHSPVTNGRGRSPVRLFERQSPRCTGSPVAANTLRSPPGSPVHLGHNTAFKALAFRPGLTHTKSLPRTPAVAPPLKCRRGRSGTLTKQKHVRGAVDIVLGLEQKRQRRKEKFYQKHCNRARKGQMTGKRPLPGQGAERMKELGLLMGGKLHGNYVLSF